MIALSYWFYKRYLDFVEDVGKVAQHIKYLRDGNFEQRLVLRSQQTRSVVGGLK